MEKVRFVDGGDYIINLYCDNNFIGSRKVYFSRGKYYVKYKSRYGEILDFHCDGGFFLASVDVNELYFK